MQGHRRTNRQAGIRRLLIGAGVLGVLALLAPSTTFADHKHDDHGRKRHHRQGHQDHGRHHGDRDHRGGHHDHGWNRGHRERHHGHHIGYRYRGHDRFAVPRQIHHRQVHTYRPYYHGRSYYRPHRHHHAVYRFPVYTPYGAYYQFYPYCGGALFVDGIGGRFAYHGRRFHVEVGF